MNIFYLDKDPTICAEYHCDKHVVKMILESAQILCTVINEKVGEQVTPYKSTHVNHPCVKWAMESASNFYWLEALFLQLENEWNYRYKHNKAHKSVQLLLNNPIQIHARATLVLPQLGLTQPALAMPDYCKVPNDPVQSYRNYYNNEKQHLHKWTNREIPFWIEN